MMKKNGSRIPIERHEVQMKKRFTLPLLSILLAGSLILPGCSGKSGESTSESTGKTGSQSHQPGKTDPGKSETVICVDAGHGVGDVGAVSPFQLEDGQTIYEKDINLAISLYLVEELRAMGYTVVMARGADEEEPACGYDADGKAGIVQRVTWANQQKYDLYVCVHSDSVGDSSVKGSRLYYNTGNNKKSNAALCDALSAEMAIFSGKSPIIKKDADLYAVTATRMPAVLIECGFVTNREDLANLTDPSWQQPFAGAVARGIDRYLAK